MIYSLCRLQTMDRKLLKSKVSGKYFIRDFAPISVVNHGQDGYSTLRWLFSNQYLTIKQEFNSKFIYSHLLRRQGIDIW